MQVNKNKISTYKKRNLRFKSLGAHKNTKN